MIDSTNDALDRLWRSPANTPTPDELDRLRPKLLERLRRERRGLALRLSASGAALALLSVLFVLARLGGDLAGAPGWSTGLLLVPPWIAFALFLRRLLRRRRTDVGAGVAIRAALGAALEETKAALFRARLVGLLHLVSLPAFALALAELRSTGKVRPEELASLALVLGGIVVVSGAWLFHRIRLLRPRARRLAGLLADYD
jgi:hypothetical protein